MKMINDLYVKPNLFKTRLRLYGTVTSTSINGSTKYKGTVEDQIYIKREPTEMHNYSNGRSHGLLLIKPVNLTRYRPEDALAYIRGYNEGLRLRMNKGLKGRIETIIFLSKLQGT